MNWTEQHTRLPDTMCHSREERGLAPFYVNIVLTVSVFSTNRAILSLGGLKPKFIHNEERIFKEPPFLKGL